MEIRWRVSQVATPPVLSCVKRQAAPHMEERMRYFTSQMLLTLADIRDQMATSAAMP